MFGPVVLGALGQQQRSAGLDAGGLASLLTSQKDQFAAAIPAGLADQLNASGLIDKLGRDFRTGTAAAAIAWSERPMRRAAKHPGLHKAPHRRSGPFGRSV